MSQNNKNLLITTLDKLNTEGYEVIFTSAGLGNKFGMIIKVFLRLKKKWNYYWVFGINIVYKKLMFSDEY